MTDKDVHPTDQELQAYVDDCLKPERVEAVEAALARDSELARMVQSYRQQGEALHALYDPVLDESIPAQLRPHNLSGSWPLGQWLRVAAALAIFVLGSAAGWFGKDISGPQGPDISNLASEAVSAHWVYEEEVRRAAEAVVGDENQLTAWLSQGVGADVRAPDLTLAGYDFVGGRLLPTGDGLAAQLHYKDIDGQNLTLYVRSNPHGEDADIKFVDTGDMRACYWTAGTMDYVLIGRTEGPLLLEAARNAYGQLTAGDTLPEGEESGGA